MGGNTFIESFHRGLNMAHTIENSKRVRAAARQQAQFQRMKMMEMAQGMTHIPGPDGTLVDNPMFKKPTPTSELGLYLQNNPNGTVAGFNELKQSFAKPKGDTTVMQRYFRQHPEATAEEAATFKQNLTTPRGDTTVMQRYFRQHPEATAEEAATFKQNLTTPRGDTTVMQRYFRQHPEATAEEAATFKQNLTTPGGDTTVMQRYFRQHPEATAEEAATFKKTLSTPKDEPIYPKGWNEQLGKLQGIRKARLRLESGTSDFGVQFKITPMIQSSIDQYRAMEKRQSNFLKKRFPKAWADYSTEEKAPDISPRKPNETINEYLQRTGK